MTCSSTRRTGQPPRRPRSRSASETACKTETSSAREALVSARRASRSDWKLEAMLQPSVYARTAALQPLVEGAAAVAREVQGDVEVAQRLQLLRDLLTAREDRCYARLVGLD